MIGIFVAQPNWAVMAGGAAIIVAVTLAAIASRRPALAAAFGAVVLLAIGVGAVFLSFTAFRHEAASPPQLNAELHQQLAKLDIHQLMDKADAPRIALPPDPPSPPEAGSESESPPAQETEKKDSAKAENASQNKVEPAQAEESQAHGSADPASGSEPAEHASAGESAASAAAGQPAADERRAEEAPVVPAKQQGGSPRPDWIDDPPKRIGNTWRDVIVTEEFATREECDLEADRLLLAATYEHVQVLRQRFDTGPWPPPAFGEYPLGITIDYIRREIAKDEYLDTVERSFGPMKKLYTLVEFTPAVDRELRARWDTYRRQERLTTVGIGAVSVLGLVGLAWGLLRVDTLTKGYYTKRLFVGVPAAIITVLLFLSLLLGMGT
jgi:hypothetical protein